jgi:hypothetical protein
MEKNFAWPSDGDADASGEPGAAVVSGRSTALQVVGEPGMKVVARTFPDREVHRADPLPGGEEMICGVVYHGGPERMVGIDCKKEVTGDDELHTEERGESADIDLAPGPGVAGLRGDTGIEMSIGSEQCQFDSAERLNRKSGDRTEVGERHGDGRPGQIR